MVHTHKFFYRRPISKKSDSVKSTSYLKRSFSNLVGEAGPRIWGLKEARVCFLKTRVVKIRWFYVEICYKFRGFSGVASVLIWRISLLRLEFSEDSTIARFKFRGFWTRITNASPQVVGEKRRIHLLGIAGLTREVKIDRIPGRQAFPQRFGSQHQSRFNRAWGNLQRKVICLHVMGPYPVRLDA